MRPAARMASMSRPRVSVVAGRIGRQATGEPIVPSVCTVVTRGWLKSVQTLRRLGPGAGRAGPGAAASQRRVGDMVTELLGPPSSSPRGPRST